MPLILGFERHRQADLFQLQTNQGHTVRLSQKTGKQNKMKDRMKNKCEAGALRGLSVRPRRAVRILQAGTTTPSPATHTQPHAYTHSQQTPSQEGTLSCQHSMVTFK